ncbi:MAG: amino acid ABC transporter substrate-binding protein [Pelagimonas sp.]|jgi:general L-amino acid transport system substrate-binding protein|nr:amino acid ABC transporter substrate-binding protein [Pelagimonas sp.]
MACAFGQANAGTLQDVQSAGVLNCGIGAQLVGFAAENGSDQWDGFNVGLCRAVAAATLGEGSAVNFVEAPSGNQHQALLEGDVDLLVGNGAWSFSADVTEQLDFVGISFYDGQGFLAPKSFGLSSAKELNQRTICTLNDESVTMKLDAFFERNQITYDPLIVDTLEDVSALYHAGECDVFTSDASSLAALRASLPNPGDHVLLPEIISKEPRGPVVRQDDSAWADVVRWVLNALIAAEELGVTSANAEELQKGTDTPEINRLLGSEGALGDALGLDPDWAVRAIRASGNYGELFAKTIGENTAIGLSRGFNAQWGDGGLLYALPVR